MSVITDIFETAAQNIDVEFVDGSPQEVTDKLNALQSLVNEDAFPCIVLFTEEENIEEGEFVDVIDSLMFLILKDIKPDELTEGTRDIYDELDEIKEHMAVQFAKSNQVAGIDKTKFTKNTTKKKINVGTTLCCALEVTIDNFTFKKQC